MSDSKALSEAGICHLGVKSDHSIEDGSLRLDAYLDHIQSLGHRHASLVDNASLSGAFDFHMKCKDRGISPIIGSSVHVEPSEPLANLLKEWTDPPPDVEIPPELTSLLKCIPNPSGLFHLTIIARNAEGFKTLSKLVSDSYIHGLNDEDMPVCSWDLLRKYLKADTLPNLIVMTGCGGGELTYHLRLQQALTAKSIDPLFRGFSEQLKEATASYLDSLKALTKNSELYMEVFNHNLGFETSMKHQWRELSRATSIPMVASSDAYYIQRSDLDAHMMVLAIKHNMKKSDLMRANTSSSFHIMDDAEFIETFGDLEGVVANTVRIANQCEDYGWGYQKPQIPSFKLPNGVSSVDEIRRLAEEGLKSRGFAGKKVYVDRLNYELSTINSMTFNGYYLIVRLIVNGAKKRNIAVGPGRGSGAGSLVAYCLGITDIDPIEWGLTFERFLNPERISLPDFDIDFCARFRDKVFDFIVKTFGADKAVRIGTLTKLKAKAAFKGVARVMGIPMPEVSRLIALFPSKDPTLSEALESSPELSEAMRDSPRIQEAMNMALRIEGTIINRSTHAGGIVISDRPIAEVSPLYMSLKNRRVITQYEMHNLESLGLVKFDILSLNNLTVLSDACEQIRANHDPNFSLSYIPQDDPKTYEMIAHGYTPGIFQAESWGMTDLARKVKPENLADVVDTIALHRPGALKSGADKEYVRNREKPELIKYLHPALEPILRETYGVMVYQEQVLRIAVELAGYSYGEADSLRRAMGKKKPEEMKSHRERFISGAVERGIDASIATEIFILIARFAEYGFPKAHSVGYGIIFYQTAYLKTHYRHEFMVSLINNSIGDAKKVHNYIGECCRMGIRVERPSINRSEIKFSLTSRKEIQVGLEVIKGIKNQNLSAILGVRREALFKDLLDFVTRVNLKKVGLANLRLLIKAGALDDFGYPRQALLTKKETLSRGKVVMRDKAAEMLRYSTALRKEPKKTRSKKAKKATEANLPSYPSWYEDLKQNSEGKPMVVLSDLIVEKELLGNFYSIRPIWCFSDEIGMACQLFNPPLDSTLTASDLPIGGNWSYLVAFLEGHKLGITKQGKEMATLYLQSGEYSVRGYVWEETLRAHGRIPDDNRAVIIKCRHTQNPKTSFTGLTVSAIWDVLNIVKERS